MSTQAAMIEETIIGVKKANLRNKREQDAEDDQITQPTNRGNKTRVNAQYVQERSLGVMNGEDFYRKNAEHAGYRRRILQRNPSRYDSEGDELDDDDSDATADADAAEENPYSEIALANLLAPLRHPSELPNHPSMAHPYNSKAINQMIHRVDQRLRQERYALFQAKRVHRQLLGDAPWIPCGAVEVPNDMAVFKAECFAPKPDQSSSDYNVPSQCVSSTRDSSATRYDAQAADPVTTGKADASRPPSRNGTLVGNESLDADTEMTDAPEADPQKLDTPAAKPLPSEGGQSLADQSIQQNGQAKPETEPGDSDHQSKPDTGKSVEIPADNEESNPVEMKSEKIDVDEEPKPEVEEPTKTEEELGDADLSPEPPRRMTTRAQANQAAQPSEHASSASSSTAVHSDNDSAEPHQLYHFPSVKIDSNVGLPQNEADDTRRLIWAYIQKQGETVRLFAEILEMLRRAERMKEDVWEWCKAEGHVGELSDGEDWYDREKWGLAEGEDLKKGADEEEDVDEGRGPGKRGRGRRG